MTVLREVTEKLAMHGGPKAFTGRTRPFRPQLGIEEFIALAQRYGLKPDAVERLRSTFSDDDLTDEGVFLGRFGYPRIEETCGVRFEKAAREKFGVPFARAVSRRSTTPTAGSVTRSPCSPRRPNSAGRSARR